MESRGSVPFDGRSEDQRSFADQWQMWRTRGWWVQRELGARPTSGGSRMTHVRIIIKGGTVTRGTGLDTYRICIQPILIRIRFPF